MAEGKKKGRTKGAFLIYFLLSWVPSLFSVSVGLSCREVKIQKVRTG